MKVLIILFLSLSSFHLAIAQFGFVGRYQMNEAPNWVDAYQQSEKYLGNGWSVGVDYWLRLKNYRIEFLPEINYGQFEYNDQKSYINSADFVNKFYSFFLNSNIYLFDFEGDCNCPTFSKQGQFLKKGFFVQVSPGVSYMVGKVSFEKPVVANERIFESSSVAANIGVGIGLDIGISDFVTLTPMIGMRYFPNVKWDSLSKYAGSEIYAPLSIESAIWQATAGVRLGFRFDYQTNSRRR